MGSLRLHQGSRSVAQTVQVVVFPSIEPKEVALLAQGLGRFEEDRRVREQEREREREREVGLARGLALAREDCHRPVVSASVVRAHWVDLGSRPVTLQRVSVGGSDYYSMAWHGIVLRSVALHYSAEVVMVMVDICQIPLQPSPISSRGAPNLSAVHPLLIFYAVFS